MTFAELKAEVQARGFNFVSDARIGTWINRQYHRACERYPWPFLETTTTGTSPLTISDLRAVLSVTDTTNEGALSWLDERTVLENDPNLTQSGLPSVWYLSGGAITAYPVTTDTLSVKYIKVPTDLSDDSDSPLFPTRYHYALVDGACSFAYKDSDNAEMAAQCEQDYMEAIEEAAESLMVPNYDSPAEIVVRGSIDW